MPLRTKWNSEGEIIDPRKTNGKTTLNDDTNAWLASLRLRFVQVSTRRVPADAVEDIVQDALAVVVDRGIDLGVTESVADRPALAWCFQVLRNTIGNFYQRERTRGKYVDGRSIDVLPGAPTAFDALESIEMRRHLEAVLDEMTDGPCAAYLRRLGAGDTPKQLAEDEGVEAAVLYRRVYRCRQRLRENLLKRGIAV